MSPTWCIHDQTQYKRGLQAIRAERSGKSQQAGLLTSTHRTRVIAEFFRAEPETPTHPRILLRYCGSLRFLNPHCFSVNATNK
jgi:hypothetical protein